MNGLIRFAGLALLLWSPLLVGCGQAQPAGPNGPQPPEVRVSVPKKENVTDYEDFPGRVEAVDSIDIRARVTGYLDKVNFIEGMEVKKGAVLFEIDPRLYQAEVNRQEANLLQAQARQERLATDYQRATTLLARSGISREEYDKIAGDRKEAAAAVEVAKAGLVFARQNLDFTKVQAPITGRISRRYIDPGNLVKADETVLTTLVSLDPIYVYFDLDERTTLRLQQLIRKGSVEWGSENGLPVLVGRVDDEGYPRKGTVNFADNRVDADTGTWRLRGRFANPQYELTPGLFVRVHLPIGSPYEALLVSEQAFGTDQGQKFLYVVDEANHVSYRRVKVGRLHNGLRVVSDGLKPVEKVVVSGLQRLRPGTEVRPDLVDMPVMSGSQGAPKQ
jgi:RND family efflux transporter MFP subunit